MVVYFSITIYNNGVQNSSRLRAELYSSNLATGNKMRDDVGIEENDLTLCHLLYLLVKPHIIDKGHVFSP